MPFGRRGLAWFREQDFGPIENLVRDELLGRFAHFSRQITVLDRRLNEVQAGFPPGGPSLKGHWMSRGSWCIVLRSLSGEVWKGFLVSDA